MKVKYLFLFIIYILPAQEKYSKDYFISPMDIPLSLTGTFSEIRTNHFHAGIDIPTNKKTGYPIFACADGYVSRIKVSPWGFGKAIYLNHPNGLTTVYAHLENFNSEIQEFIRGEQYKKQKFSIDQSIEKERFKILKGQIIGYSGSTGNSTGPHLHFEVRKTKNQKPINPLYFTFPIKDTINPTIKSIFIYTENENFNLEKKEYQVKNKLIINEIISGKFGLGVQVYDKNNNTSVKTGINKIEIYINNDIHYKFELNEFLFSEKKFVNSHIDYEERINSRRKIHKCFLEKNNQLLTAYPYVKNNGWIMDLKNGKNFIDIIIYDNFNNKTNLSFTLNYENSNVEKKINNKNKLNEYYINSNKDYFFNKNNVDVMIKKGNLYKDCYFKFDIIKKEKKHSEYVIGNKNNPVHKNFTLSILPDEYLLNEKKIAIGQLNGGRWSYIKSRRKGNKITCNPKSFGIFTVIQDDKKPTIKAVNLNEKMTKQKSIKFKVKDNFSGINYYSASINGEWILLEYDAKNNLLEHFFEPKAKKNKQNKLTITVKDGLGNANTQQYSFER